MMIKISVVVAMANNNVIGMNNALPWRLSEDLKRFKSLTLGHPIVMGRKTFDSIGRALPGRQNIVVSRQSALSLGEGIIVVSSLDEALREAKKSAIMSGVDQIMVIGGANFYQQVLPIADRLYITKVDADLDGDAFFPTFNESDWLITNQEFHQADQKNEYDTIFMVMNRSGV